MKAKDTEICIRLGQERKRLHLNQHKVADYCSVSIKTIGRWEKNIPIPADKLALLAQLGYDITYILTGVKLISQLAGLEAAADIWKLDNNRENMPQDNDSGRLTRIFENLANSNDRERLKQIGLALVGYSQSL